MFYIQCDLLCILSSADTLMQKHQLLEWSQAELSVCSCSCSIARTEQQCQQENTCKTYSYEQLISCFRTAFVTSMHHSLFYFQIHPVVLILQIEPLPPVCLHPTSPPSGSHASFTWCSFWQSVPAFKPAAHHQSVSLSLQSTHWFLRSLSVIFITPLSSPILLCWTFFFEFCCLKGLATLL